MDSVDIGLPTDKSKILLIDFEATCSKDNSIPREEMEIIEIGAILFDKTTLKVIREYNSFIKPVRKPILTEFCTELTTITQEQVDQARGFGKVLSEFEDQMIEDQNQICFASWGNYDKNQMLQDCKYHDVSYPFDGEHLNIKTWMAKRQGWSRPKSVGAALQAMNMEFEGTPHRGIDDVRNMVRMLHKLKSDMT